MPGTPAPNWHVQYRKHEAEQIGWFATPEEAIETACDLINDGLQRFRDRLRKEQIARTTRFGRRISRVPMHE